LNEANLSGIVQFPSFHAAAAVILTYSARGVKWLLAVLAPVNALVILATLPCGGHYLVDTIAGLAVAVISILIVRKTRREIVMQESSNAAARADAWRQA